MGNGCFCKNSNYIKDINLESSPMQPIINTKSEQMNPKDEEETEKKKLHTLIHYFNQSEKELMTKIKKKEKIKINSIKKLSAKKFDTIVNNDKYELMMERLLAQKNIKRCGPKRRKTIRKGEEINNIVKEILKENKDNIKKIEKEKINKNGSIIIKDKQEIKGRLSFMYDRNKELIKFMNKK